MPDKRKSIKGILKGQLPELTEEDFDAAKLLMKGDVMSALDAPDPAVYSAAIAAVQANTNVADPKELGYVPSWVVAVAVNAALSAVARQIDPDHKPRASDELIAERRVQSVREDFDDSGFFD